MKHKWNDWNDVPKGVLVYSSTYGEGVQYWIKLNHSKVLWLDDEDGSLRFRKYTYVGDDYEVDPESWAGDGFHRVTLPS